jgi:GntR family transcriptional regulator
MGLIRLVGTSPTITCSLPAVKRDGYTCWYKEDRLADALYRRIAADLRAAIRAGRLTPGSQLPTEQELIDRYGVSRNTVRLALGALANEGVITSSHGRGTFVRDVRVLTYYASRAERVDQLAGEADSYVAEVREQGREPSQEFQLRIEPAVAEIAERLDMEEGQPTVVRSLLRLVDGQPWSLQDSYYPMDLAQGTELMTPADIARGTTRVLQELGHSQVGYVDELSTRMPSPEEATTLRLGTGTPVLVYARTGWTRKRPVRLTRTVFAGDRNRVVYHVGDLEALARHDA